MRTLTRLLSRSWHPPVTVCESCGQACTASCRAGARADRDRTAALARALPR